MSNTITDLFNKVISVFSTFSLSDFFDILVVAIIIYVCVRIVRETRGMQLAKGILFFVIVYAVVDLVGMEASGFIFKNIFSNILLIIVVLFGPEIRDILEQVGHGTATKSLKSIIHPGVAVDIAELSNSIEEICKACADMSDKKVGALICFENNTLLGNIISSGTELNAKVSRELVENIFYPKSPLHDGAVVIRDGRVFAAGCILPLTKKTVTSALGTRHRAGIGLTEESDALVVIVSEETGAISVAKGGTLERGVSYGELRDIITTEFLPTGSASDDKIISKLVRRIKK